MLLKILTLSWDAQAQALDDTPLVAFLNDPEWERDLLEVGEEFFFLEAAPYLLLTLRYRQRQRKPEPNTTPYREQDRKDWRKELDKAERALFEHLRTWRAEQAREQGIPHYLICTNKQLAEIVRLKPGTLAELRSIEGVGEGRSKRWGASLLKRLRAVEGLSAEEGMSEGADSDAAKGEPGE